MPPGTWTFAQVAAHYGFPTNLTGNETVAIFEAGGGWYPADIGAAAAWGGYAAPNVTDISVDGTTNSPGDPNVDLETALDIQGVAAIHAFVTGNASPANIRVYWAQSIAAAIRAAQADGAMVFSCSWGEPEIEMAIADIGDLESAIAAYVDAGGSFWCAAGDAGATDDPNDPDTPTVDAPASCPSAVAGGATTLAPSSEIVWSLSGGGFSKVFPAQPWQTDVTSPAGLGRGLPDMTINGDPNTGYGVIYAGALEIVGGTSCFGPVMSGWASGNEAQTNDPGAFYAVPTAFNDITVGNNVQDGVGYQAAPGWDACSGLGSPIGFLFQASFG
jgi:kumamolisin